MTERSQEENALAGLFERAGATIPDPSAALIDASIDQGVVRSRRRGARQIVAIAASAALVGSVVTLSTVGLRALDGTGPDPAAPTSAGPAAARFGVAPDQMGATLEAVLARSPGAGERDLVSVGTGTRPWADGVRDRAGFPGRAVAPLVESAQAGWVRYRRGEDLIDVEVLVQRLSGPVGGAVGADDPALWSEAGAALLQTGSGRVFLQGGSYGRSSVQGGVATLVTDDGWLVSVAVSDASKVPVDALALVALDSVWIR